ncbi:hypothetical protein AYO21_06488 [Fonsecaea monophora]|uniref:Uncharacterized protein n=1 Tax=Fonsecaea monophora TaxID=254056 RepID=A0A177F4V2_9EURO|nr:hypothetical protein AYO21_06488 [Fonsecaea monophora]KAH0830959.1 hypothetical protein FOPE_02094 [Fonsecaea pedrosoi]OAG39284.1 hypothetical protein AYO21_06488 [Fonsecaea monophora]
MLGCLNKIGPDTVLVASNEIKQGHSISLKSVVTAITESQQGRHDEFNTQCSSQWDSLCHFYHRESASAYSGCKPPGQELVQGWGEEDNEKRLPTLDHWHERGGLVARGVLIDFKAYADSKCLDFAPFGDYGISLSQPEESKSIRRGIPRAAKWFWNKGFAVVARDNVGFEVEHADGTAPVLHPYLLSLFGMPIAELRDLKALSAHRAKTGRYSFFLTSVLLNVAGAVGSPPNALAVF